MDPEAWDQALELAQEESISLAVEAGSYNRQLEETLSQLEFAKLTRLSIAYEISEWVESLNGSAHDDETWSKQIELAGIELNLVAELKHLTELSLELNQDGLGQREQLKPFCGLPSLEAVSLDNLSKEGAEYMLETRDRWPADATFEFDFTEDVPEEIKRQLDAKFPSPIYQLHRSVIPVVGERKVPNLQFHLSPATSAVSAVFGR